MNWKLILFVVFIFVFTVITVAIQSIAYIDAKYIVLPQLAPALSYLITILLFKKIFRPIIFSFNKITCVKAIFAMIIPMVLFTLTYFIGKLLGIEVKIKPDLFPLIFVMLPGIIIGSIGEEIGWRSFFQPSLENKFPVIVSSLIVGCIWGLWHVGHYKNGLIFMLGFLLFTISASIIIVYLLRGTQYNLVISSIFHISINSGFMVFFYNNLENTKLFLINGFVWFLIAIILAICGRKYYCVKNS
jgi:membrane protease YdiL (CAAX protease family)